MSGLCPGDYRNRCCTGGGSGNPDPTPPNPTRSCLRDGQTGCSSNSSCCDGLVCLDNGSCGPQPSSTADADTCGRQRDVAGTTGRIETSECRYNFNESCGGGRTCRDTSDWLTRIGSNCIVGRCKGSNDIVCCN